MLNESSNGKSSSQDTVKKVIPKLKLKNTTSPIQKSQPLPENHTTKEPSSSSKTHAPKTSNTLEEITLTKVELKSQENKAATIKEEKLSATINEADNKTFNEKNPKKPAIKLKENTKSSSELNSAKKPTIELNLNKSPKPNPTVNKYETQKKSVGVVPSIKDTAAITGGDLTASNGDLTKSNKIPKAPVRAQSKNKFNLKIKKTSPQKNEQNHDLAKSKQPPPKAQAKAIMKKNFEASFKYTLFAVAVLMLLLFTTLLLVLQYYNNSSINSLSL